MTGSAKSMVISMVVVLAACLLWIAMVPRVSNVSQPVVDVPGIAREVGLQQHWAVALPQGLSKDWIPTNVRLLKYDGSQPTWHAGYQGPSGKYLSLEQTLKGNEDWVKNQTGFGSPAGTVTLAGATWTRYSSSDKDQRSLVRDQPLAGLSTVVTGKADWPELEVMAAALKPGKVGATP